MPCSTFYYRCKRLDAGKYSEVREAIRVSFEQHTGRYGYRRIARVLRQQGYALDRRTVLLLMRRDGLKCVCRKVPYGSYKGDVGRTAPDLPHRESTAEAPDRKWTACCRRSETLYLSPIMDLYDGEVVSYARACNPRFESATRMSDMAFDRIEGKADLPIRSGMALPDGAVWKRIGDER